MYQRFSSTGYKYLGIRKLAFVAGNQFLWKKKRKISEKFIYVLGYLICEQNSHNNPVLKSPRFKFELDLDFCVENR